MRTIVMLSLVSAALASHLSGALARGGGGGNGRPEASNYAIYQTVAPEPPIPAAEEAPPHRAAQKKARRPAHARP